tara:strand:- start:594 stop:1187 length:594 start_codon:yes stop_codon:yes gene_type:complete
MQPLKAKRIWLLGASTGGLQAVRQFLSNVPVTSDLAFVYAQHIGGQQMATVLRMIETQAGWPAREPSTGQFIRPGAVTLISPQFETRVSRQGWILRFGSSWQGRYAPSIDQLANRLAQLYRQNCGAIIFTGMGDDGARGCCAVKEYAGQVWVQDPLECTVPAMPQAVIERCETDFIGSVDQLASRISEDVNQMETCS